MNSLCKYAYLDHLQQHELSRTHLPERGAARGAAFTEWRKSDFCSESSFSWFHRTSQTFCHKVQRDGFRCVCSGLREQLGTDVLYWFLKATSRASFFNDYNHLPPSLLLLFLLFSHDMLHCLVHVIEMDTGDSRHLAALQARVMWTNQLARCKGSGWSYARAWHLTREGLGFHCVFNQSHIMRPINCY